MQQSPQVVPRPSPATPRVQQMSGNLHRSPSTTPSQQQQQQQIYVRTAGTKVVDRLDQDNYTDPAAAPRALLAPPPTMAEILDGCVLRASSDDDSEDYDADEAPAAKRQKRKRGRPSQQLSQQQQSQQQSSHRRRLPAPRAFNRVLDDPAVRMLPAHVPSWISAAAPAPVRPRRWFCCVCGALSPYRCVRCGARFCSLQCDATHKDTRCLKFVR